MKVENQTTGAILADNVRRADGLFVRATGFIGRRAVASNEGLWFDRCSAIHTLGCRTPLDVLFLDRAGCVLKVAVRVRPSRLAVLHRGAYTVVEFGHGAIARNDVLPGDQIVLSF